MKTKSNIRKSMQSFEQSLTAAAAAPMETPMEPNQNEVEVVPTMSKTDLLLACPWPWGRKVPPEKAGPGARLGSAFHKAMEQALTTYLVLNKTPFIDYEKIARDFDCPAKELKTRFSSAWPTIVKWLGGDNQWNLNFTDQYGECFIECSVAYDVQEGTARQIAPPVRDHIYEDKRPNELPGTVDLAMTCSKYLLVLDWKTGEEVPEVGRTSGQLLSLALAFQRMLSWQGEIIIGIGHTPWTGITTIYVDTADGLEQHADKLRRAFEQRGSSWLHPHAGCPLCPAFSICPTQTPTLDIIRRKHGALTTREEVGSAHYHLQVYRKQFEKLDSIITSQIRDAVAAMGPCPRPDGKVVDLVKRPFTNLSMSSIKRQLGEVEGKKLIDKLEELGAIEHGERYELREVND
jgi:hypothetical protein